MFMCKKIVVPIHEIQEKIKTTYNLEPPIKIQKILFGLEPPDEKYIDFCIANEIVLIAENIYKNNLNSEVVYYYYMVLKLLNKLIDEDWILIEC